MDSTTDEHELALLTGLSVQEVEAAVNRLFDLGAIEFLRGERGGGSRPAPRPSTASQSPSAPPISQRTPPRRTLSSHPASSPNPPRRLYDPAELEEDIELDLDRKRRILDMFYQLGELSHYELLRVEKTAERKQIKTAYYELAPELHTDTYFGKRLGSYKAKIETIFSRVTMAHDVLTHRDRRAEYDRQLELQEKARAAAEPPESRRSSGGGVDTEPSVHTERARREVLAKKLSGGYRRPSSGMISSAAAEAPAPPSEDEQRRAQIELARRAVELEPSSPEPRLTLARAYFAEGMEKRAHAELEQAAALAPGDARIKRRIDEIIELSRRRGKVG